MKRCVVAATQMKCSFNESENINNAISLVRGAAAAGANIILLQELFSTVYFMQECNYEYFSWARPLKENRLISEMQDLAKELRVVLPISFFEKANEAYYNSVAVIDANGEVLGIYRKSHIPDDPGYYEKFYFSPGDTGFRVWDTAYGRIGVGICWDQWFPEAARCMALKGAQLLLYPTAIGTEPDSPMRVRELPIINRRWQNAMIGQAIDNMIPIVASNRTGIEEIGGTALRFFGTSFITNAAGEVIKEMGEDEEGFIVAALDLDGAPKTRVLRFRDRRPELYDTLLTKDGSTRLHP